MKLNIKSILTLGLSGILMAGCSDEAEMPVNPTIPVAAKLGNEMVIYEANPRFFAGEGCLDALTARLDEIKALGTTVLWVMPVNTPGEKNAIGSPYCIKDYKGVNPKYGTMTDMKELVDAAHAKGMKVILDWIANHTSWDNAWITEHSDWYEKDASGNIISPDGWTDVASLDYSNADMRAAMIDALKYWVTESGIDGFRMDHVDGVPHDFWTDAIAQLRGVRSDLLMLAESSDVQCFADGFDITYGWSYASKLQNLFAGKITPMQLYKESNTELASVPEGKMVMRYAINHDVAAENSVESLFGNADGMLAAYVLTSMLGEVPMIYSSQECSYTGKLSFFDYNPLDWSKGNAAAYKAIARAYAQSAEVRGGELRTFENGKVATFGRLSGEHFLLVMVNTSKDVATAKVPISYAGTTMTNLISNEAETMPVSVDLPAYGYRIWLK